MTRRWSQFWSHSPAFSAVQHPPDDSRDPRSGQTRPSPDPRTNIWKSYWGQPLTSAVCALGADHSSQSVRWRSVQPREQAVVPSPAVKPRLAVASGWRCLVGFGGERWPLRQARPARRTSRHHHRRRRIRAGLHAVQADGRSAGKASRRARHPHSLPARRHSRRTALRPLVEPRSRTRPPTARTASARTNPSRYTNCSRREPWRTRWRRCSKPSVP